MRRSLHFETFDPLGAFVRRGFERAVLDAAGPGDETATGWVAATRAQAWEIYRRDRDEYDAAGRAHLRIAAHVLALRRALVPRLGAETAVDVLKAALADAYRPLFRRPLPLVLRLVHRPARLIGALGGSRLLQRAAFGAGFAITTRTGGATIELLVDRCLYHRFFAGVGAPELTAVICHSDSAWIDALPRDRRTLGIERPQTLGWGGARCVFRFTEPGRSAR